MPYLDLCTYNNAIPFQINFGCPPCNIPLCSKVYAKDYMVLNDQVLVKNIPNSGLAIPRFPLQVQVVFHAYFSPYGWKIFTSISSQ